MPGFPECFAAYGADHRDTMARFLGSESLYLRFLDMLPQDDNLRKLGAALADGDLERAFLAAHTLKGVAGNLGLLPLSRAVCAIVEPLRAREARDYGGTLPGRPGGVPARGRFSGMPAAELPGRMNPTGPAFSPVLRHTTGGTTIFVKGEEPMEHLKNLPSDQVAALAQMVTIQPGRVVSMALSRNEHCQMTLLAFADGESVSEECYFGDTLYYVLEGEMPLQMGDRVYPLRAGDCMAVPAHTLHAVGGSLPFKLLQITLQ